MLKNITFSADEALIEQARKRAAEMHVSLNELFRAWLASYVAEPAAADAYARLMARLDHGQAGRRFSRQELNERR